MRKNLFGKQAIVLITLLLSLSLFFGGFRPAVSAAQAKLTASEAAHLRFIREEEKLARDIYYVLAEMWDLKIFVKIAESEQRHTDAVRIVIEKYAISDPAKATPPGVFANEELQKLYTILNERGKVSSLEALKIGALTEEKDIADINVAMKDTAKPDLLDLYAYLKDGSSMHLRGFMAEIRQAGGDYSPQFLSQEEFEKAIKGNE